MNNINSSNSNASEIDIIQEWLDGTEHPRNEILELLRIISNQDYEQFRINAARKLGWRVSALDTERRLPTTNEAETSDLFPELDHWEQPVNGQDLLNDVKHLFKRHVVFAAEAATACCLWVLHTYAFDATSVSPILAITSPEKRCGKTTLLAILDALSFRSLASGSITTASVFRIIEQHRPTLLIDEADTFLSDNEVLRGVINSGHTRSTARVVRCVGENHEPRPFSTWAPKAIACIGDLPETIRDRSIEIRMQRKKNTDKVERFRERDRVPLHTHCRKMLRWTLDNVDKLRDLEPQTVDCLGDRAADSWEPLLAIADQIGGTWPDEARKAAIELSCLDAQISIQTQLLVDIREIFESLKNIDRIQSQELVDRLIRMEERPWDSFSHGRGITTRNMAAILKSYGISSRDIRFESGTRKGYFFKDFHEVFTRYLPTDSATSATSINIKGLEGNIDATDSDDVADSNPDKAMGNNKVARVADIAYGISRHTKDPGD